MSISRSKESTPIRKTNTMEITGGLISPEFLGILLVFEDSVASATASGPESVARLQRVKR